MDFALQLIVELGVERFEQVALRDGLCAIADFKVSQAEVVVGFGLARVETHGLPVGFDGFVEASRIEVGVAELVVCLDGCRAQAYGLLKGAYGVAVLALFDFAVADRKSTRLNSSHRT